MTQVDDTGLVSGDLFPVGLTLITFVAEDACGNTASCELKIIVNDFHTPPTLECGADIIVENDPAMCGAIVNGIAPIDVTDNCPANLSVVYRILDGSGDILSSGFEDASGTKFPTGTNNVEYTVSDQPLILITEIVQDGSISGVELTNFGPSSVDISCLDIIREGTSPESFNVPNGVVLGVGDVYTHSFTNINASSAAGYYLSFVGTVIDGVSINGYNSATYSFGGNIFGDNIYRHHVSDADGAMDFTIASSCFVGSYGSLNPGLPLMTDNGTTSGLQEAIPSSVSCSFNVTVEDTEPAFCAQFDTLRYCMTDLIELNTESCTQIPISVPAGIVVGDVNLNGLVINHPDAGDLSISLTSPSGTTILLINNQCASTADVNISFDDTNSQSLVSVTCGALGQGATYQSLESFEAFYNEAAGGDWILGIANGGTGVGQVEALCLEILELVPYTQADVSLSNDQGDCGAGYVWQHPQINENCGEAFMTVTYESDDNIAVPASGSVATGEIESQFFSIGVTRVIYTITDAAGNKSICSFEVTVADTELPTIDAALCQDQVIQLAAGQCVVPVTALNLPPILDNCGTGNLSFTPAVSAGLPSGDHPISLGIIDGFGNAADCNFMVTVLPFVPTTDQMSCLGQVNLSLGPACLSLIHI